jgi:hypothetical protein
MSLSYYSFVEALSPFSVARSYTHLNLIIQDFSVFTLVSSDSLFFSSHRARPSLSLTLFALVFLIALQSPTAVMRTERLA